MDIDSNKLDILYKSYGFKIRQSSSNNVKVYTYRSGYFNNADIVAINPEADTNKEIIEYQRSGFACTVRNYKSLEEAEKELFEGFFSLESTKRKFQDEEEKFSKKQTNLIGAKYKFISPPYRESYKENQEENNKPITDHLLNELKEPGPRLIILEAAAGYGKTCTSFELLKKTLIVFKEKLPFFIELSRNRQAKIFRYVLLDEIDRNFPSLSASLVQKEIENGKILLIVDGFDELLHRTEATSPDYNKVEPMLETLSDLLKGNAKIVLTSRKTAIFSGDHFHMWMENHENDFHISRYSLLTPNIEDWLPYERRIALENSSFPIEKISNPVLLAFLGGQEDQNFEKLVKEPNEIVKYYFSRLLDREKERQELLMDVDEQYRVFTDLASHMMESDFTAEDHEYLQLYISEKNSSLLTKVRSRYPADTRPTTEELSAKLVSHALLDRKGEQSDRVGFVNDFVLGNFVGEYLISTETTDQIVGDDFLEQTVTSFRPRSDSERKALWNKLKFSLEFLHSENRVLSEIALCGIPAHKLTGETFTGVVFDNTKLGYSDEITECVFADCTFSKVNFKLNNLCEVTFVGCRFYECVFDQEPKNEKSNAYLTGCSGNFQPISDFFNKNEDHSGEYLNTIDQYKKTVLEQFWPVGRPNFNNKKQLITLYKGHSNEERILVSSAIESLQHEGVLVIKGDTAVIDHSNIQRLREILGR